MAHSAKPPKPAGQGSFGGAVTQQPNAFNKPGPANTANADKDVVANTSGSHPIQTIGNSQPRGYGG